MIMYPGHRPTARRRQVLVAPGPCPTLRAARLAARMARTPELAGAPWQIAGPSPPGCGVLGRYSGGCPGGGGAGVLSPRGTGRWLRGGRWPVAAFAIHWDSARSVIPEGRGRHWPADDVRELSAELEQGQRANPTPKKTASDQTGRPIAPRRSGAVSGQASPGRLRRVVGTAPQVRVVGSRSATTTWRELRRPAASAAAPGAPARRPGERPELAAPRAEGSKRLPRPRRHQRARWRQRLPGLPPRRRRRAACALATRSHQVPAGAH